MFNQKGQNEHERKPDNSYKTGDAGCAPPSGGVICYYVCCNKMPFVFCDEETYDDEVFLYYRLEDAKNKAKELDDRKYKTGVAKLSENVFWDFIPACIQWV